MVVAAVTGDDIGAKLVGAVAGAGVGVRVPETAGALVGALVMNATEEATGVSVGAVFRTDVTSDSTDGSMNEPEPSSIMRTAFATIGTPFSFMANK